MNEDVFGGGTSHPLKDRASRGCSGSSGDVMSFREWVEIRPMLRSRGVLRRWLCSCGATNRVQARVCTSCFRDR
jgi:hypothetical protein